MRALRRTSVLLAGALVVSGVAMLPAEATQPARTTQPTQSTQTTEPAQPTQVPAPTTVEVEGTVRAVVVDRFGDEPSSDHRFMLVTDDGAEIPVDLPHETPADARFEGELVVDGDVEAALAAQRLLPDAGDTIQQDTRAGRVAVAAAEGQETPLQVASSTVDPVAAAAAVPAAHRAYVAKMTDQGSVEGTDAAVLSSVRGSLQYWVDESDGAITSFEPVGALRSFDSTADIGPADACGMNDPDQVWDQAAGLFPGVDFAAAGNHLIVVVGDECGDAGPVGVATVGSSIADGGLSMLTFESTALYSVSVHEIGHNVGLGHANLDRCDASQDCEYLDLYSPMALAVTGRTFYAPALGTLYRQQLGLTRAGEVATVDALPGRPTEQQTFTLAPRGAETGLRGLRVTDPVTGSTYSIDWRRPRNSRDDGSFYGSSYPFAAPDPLYPPGVVVEREGVGRGGAPDGEIYLATRQAGGRVVGSFGAGSSFAPSPGLRIGVTSTGNDATGATATVTVTVDGSATPQVSSDVPLLSARPVVGRTVSVSPGAWTSGTEFTYDWRLEGTSTGVTDASYSVPPSAVGRTLTVAVTGRRSGYLPATRESSGSTVAAGTFAPGSAQTSSPAVGAVASLDVVSWPSDVTLTYQWFANDVPVAGATSRSFRIPEALFRTALRVVVTGSRPGYVPASASSTARVVAPGRLAVRTPRISGSARVGRTLKVSVGSWSPRPTFRYQWFANGRSITSKGTKSSFRLTSKQRGKRITVRVTGTRPAYVAEARTSARTAKVARR